MADHARLSASGSAGWINCPKWATHNGNDPRTTSIYAEEGTFAHSIAEKALRSECDAEDFIGETYYVTIDSKDHEFVCDAEMAEHVQVYLDYVRRHIGDLEIEVRCDYSPWVEDGFGTSDAVVLMEDDCLEKGIVYDVLVADLKYGKGVKVFAEENSQPMLYCLGVLNDYGDLYDIQTFKIAIIQPRLDHIDEWEISVKDLLKWAENVLVPAAKRALSLERTLNYYNPGEKQCRWCSFNSKCEARAKYLTQDIIGDFDNFELPTDEIEEDQALILKSPDELTKEQISSVLEKSKDIKSWLKSIEDYASDTIQNGEQIPGFKLVEGRSNRQWEDEEAASKALARRGFKESDRCVKKLKSVAQIEKLIGKNDRLLKKHVVKPQGSPTLVPESDKRPAIEFCTEDEFDSIEIEPKNQKHIEIVDQKGVEIHQESLFD